MLMDDKKKVAEESIEPPKKENIPMPLIAVAVTIGVLLFLTVWLVSFAGCMFDRTEPAETETETEKETREVSYPIATSAKRDSYLPKTEDSTQLITATVDAKYAALVDLSDYRVIASKKGDEKIYPASMTKVMTLIVACDHVTDPDEIITVSAEIVERLKDSGASVMSLSAGEQISVRSLLYGLIMKSAGDAAQVLAEHIAGSEEAFVSLMNQKAAQMGLTQTHFVNCTGLHSDDHYTTCKEMAAIFAYALDNAFTKDVLTAREYNAPAYYEKDFVYYLKAGWATNFTDYNLSLNLSNGLTVCGGKTGYTADTYDDAGNPEKNHCLVTCAKSSDGHVYVLVTAGGTGVAKGRATDATTIYTTYIK